MIGGIKNFYTDNNGKTYNYPKSVVREFQRIKKLQAIKDKKAKNSNNYNKIMIRLNKAYERMNNLKYNFIEQLTTELCKNHHIVIEDINITDFLFNMLNLYQDKILLVLRQCLMINWHGSVKNLVVIL